MATSSAAQTRRKHVPVAVAVGLVAVMTSCRERSTTETRPKTAAPSGSDVVDTADRRIPLYPSAQLVAKSFVFSGDLTSKPLDTTGLEDDRVGNAVWACSYVSSDDTFARATITLFNGDTHLTAKRKTQLEQLAAKSQKEMAELEHEADCDAVASLADSTIRVFQFSPKRKGYGYVAGFGPGGVGYDTSWSSPDGVYDVRLEINFSFSQPLVKTEATEKYHTALTRPLALLEHAAKVLDGALFADTGGYKIGADEAVRLIEPAAANESRSDEIEFKEAPVVDLGEVRRFVGHREPVRCLAVSTDAKQLLSGCGNYENFSTRRGSFKRPIHDSSVRLWDLETGKQVLKLGGHQRMVEAVAFAPDGGTAASVGADGTLRIWNLKSGTEIANVSAHGGYTAHCVGFCLGGEKVYSAGSDGMVRIWNLDGSESNSLKLTNWGIETASLSKNRTQLLAANSKWNAWLIDLADGAIRRSFKIPAGAACIELSPDGSRFLATSHHVPIRLYDTQNGSLIREFAGHDAYEVSCSSFTPDGRRFVSCGDDQTLRIWDVETGREIERIEGFPDGLNCVVLSPDGQFAIAAGGGSRPSTLDYTIRMWRLPQ